MDSMKKVIDTLDSPAVTGVTKVLEVASYFVPFLGVAVDLLQIVPNISARLKKSQKSKRRVELVRGIMNEYRIKLGDKDFQILLSAAADIKAFAEKDMPEKKREATSEKACKELIEFYGKSYKAVSADLENIFAKIDEAGKYTRLKEQVCEFVTRLGDELLALETEMLSDELRTVVAAIEKEGERQHDVTRNIIETNSVKIEELIKQNVGAAIRGIRALGQEMRGTPEEREAEEPLLRKPIYKSGGFVCREKILSDIDAAFKSNKAVVLYGLGGMGKTEIAKAFAADYGYDCPQMIFVGDGALSDVGLKDIVFSATFTENEDARCGVLDSEDKQYEYKLRKLKQYGENTLLVVDNYNSIDDFNLEAVVNELNCKTLITTRAAKLNVNAPNIAAIEVAPFDENDMFTMFGCALTVANAEEYCEKNRDVLRKVFDIVHYHTMTARLIAGLISENVCTVEKIYERLQSQDYDFGSIRFAHNDSKSFDTILGHLETLFECSNMSEDEINILRQLTLIDNGGIDEEIFLNTLSLKDAGLIVRLSGLGYIIRDTKSSPSVLGMHPLVRESIVAQTKPSGANCREILSYLRERCTANSATLFSELTVKKNAAAHALWVLRKHGSGDVLLSEKYVQTLGFLGLVGDALAEIAAAESHGGEFSPALCYQKVVLGANGNTQMRENLAEAMNRCAENGCYDWAVAIGKCLMSLLPFAQINDSDLPDRLCEYAVESDYPLYAIMMSSFFGKQTQRKKKMRETVSKHNKTYALLAEMYDIVGMLMPRLQRFDSEDSLFGAALKTISDMEEDEEAVLDSFSGLWVIRYAARMKKLQKKAVKYFIDEFDLSSPELPVMKYMLSALLADENKIVLKAKRQLDAKYGAASEKFKVLSECAQGLNLNILTDFFKTLEKESPILGDYYGCRKVTIRIYWRICKILSGDDAMNIRNNLVAEQEKTVKEKLDRAEYNSETVGELRILIELLQENGQFEKAREYSLILSELCKRCLGRKNNIVVDSYLYLYDSSVPLLNSGRINVDRVFVSKVLPLMKERLEYYEGALGGDSAEMADYYMDYAMKMHNCGFVGDAVTYAERAWKVYERQGDSSAKINAAKIYCGILMTSKNEENRNTARALAAECYNRFSARSVSGNKHLWWFAEFLGNVCADEKKEIEYFTVAAKCALRTPMKKEAFFDCLKLGAAYAQCGEYKNAVRACKTALKLDKSSCGKYHWLVTVFFREGKRLFADSVLFEKLLKKYYAAEKKSSETVAAYAGFEEFFADIVGRYKELRSVPKQRWAGSFGTIYADAVCAKMLQDLGKLSQDGYMPRGKFEYWLMDYFVNAVLYFKNAALQRTGGAEEDKADAAIGEEPTSNGGAETEPK